MKARQLAGNRSPRWAFMDRFEVPDLDHPERTYLTRWRIIQTPWFGVLLHRMDGPDSRATLHDHPWSFVSIILRGGYDELTETRAVQRVRRATFKRAEDAHSISCLLRVPTWTLVFCGPRRREWGYVESARFWTRYDRHLHAREFDAAMAARSGR